MVCNRLHRGRNRRRNDHRGQRSPHRAAVPLDGCGRLGCVRAAAMPGLMGPLQADPEGRKQCRHQRDGHRRPTKGTPGHELSVTRFRVPAVICITARRRHTTHCRGVKACIASSRREAVSPSGPAAAHGFGEPGHIRASFKRHTIASLRTGIPAPSCRAGRCPSMSFPRAAENQAGMCPGGRPSQKLREL